MWKCPIVLLCSAFVLFSMVAVPALGGIVLPDGNGQVLKSVAGGIGPATLSSSGTAASAHVRILPRSFPLLVDQTGCFSLISPTWWPMQVLLVLSTR